MYQLIIKDILLLKTRIFLLPIFYSFFLLLFFNDIIGATIVGIVVSLMLLQTTVVYDDLNKSEVVINSLPVKRTDVVLARYLTLFIYIAISIISYWLVSLVIIHLGFSLQTVNLNLTIVVSVILGVSLLSSIYLPIMYKYGYIKAKIFHVLFVMVAFFAPSFLIAQLEANPENSIILWGKKFLASLTAGQINLLFLTVSLIIWTISFFISVHFYQKRDF